MRTCLDCGIDISDRHLPAKRCVPCANSRDRGKEAIYIANWRKANLEKVKDKARQNYKENKEKLKAASATWKKNNPEKVRSQNSRSYAHHAENITNCYVASHLRLPVAKCPPELIGIKREQISIKRISNDLKKSIKQLKEKA